MKMRWLVPALLLFAALSLAACSDGGGGALVAGTSPTAPTVPTGPGTPVVPPDADGDGIPDTLDPDDDNDGIADDFDAFPTDPSEWVDMDDTGDIALLGEAIFFDTNLSEPAGQSCASCHDPGAGLADPDAELPVSEGAIAGRFASRNAQSISYARFSPLLHFDPTMRPGIMEGMYVGGLFWDGRADNLVLQAKEPFLNILEMNKPDKRSVVLAVRSAEYAPVFDQVFGPEVLADLLSAQEVDLAYTCVAKALAIFMSSPDVSPFTSKYDAWRLGKAELAEEELSGYKLFTGKAFCFRCHAEPIFTNFGHQNLGTPPNLVNPFYDLPAELNPDGVNYIDRGLGDVLRQRGFPEEEAAGEDGKFKIPSLRNCAITPPYHHNGGHETLHDVIMFNNTRDETWADWPLPEVPENVHRHMPPKAGTFGRLGLTDPEIDDLVAFLGTLTDGYLTPAAENRYPVAAAGPDQNAVTGTTVRVDGSGSTDPDGDAVTYRWNFVAVPMKMQMDGMQMVPVVSKVAFSNAALEAPTFVPDIPGIYNIALTVTDGEVRSVDLMQVTVANAP
jgi:cytochrome c peroxidase